MTGAPVTPKRMVLYPQVVNEIGIDLNRALAWRNMIKDFRITEIEKSDIDETKVKRVFLCYTRKDFALYKRWHILWTE